MKISTVRDGQGRIIGNTISFSNGDTVARDRSGKILGRSSETFNNTRDRGDRITRSNSADASSLFRK